MHNIEEIKYKLLQEQHRLREMLPLLYDTNHIEYGLHESEKALISNDPAQILQSYYFLQTFN